MIYWSLNFSHNQLAQACSICLVAHLYHGLVYVWLCVLWSSLWLAISIWCMYGVFNILFLQNQVNLLNVMPSLWTKVDLSNHSNWIDIYICYIVLPTVYLLTRACFIKCLEMVSPTYKLSGKVLTVGVGLNCRQRVNCRQRFQLSA